MTTYTVTYQTSTGNNAVKIAAKSAYIAQKYVEVHFHTKVISIK